MQMQCQTNQECYAIHTNVNVILISCNQCMFKVLQYIQAYGTHPPTTLFMCTTWVGSGHENTSIILQYLKVRTFCKEIEITILQNHKIEQTHEQ